MAGNLTAGGASATAQKAPILGIYATYASRVDSKELFVSETGEVLGEKWSYEAALIERYALQSQARRAMLEQWRKDGQQGKAHRVTVCRRWLVPRGKGLPVYAEIHKHQDTGRAFFSGTQICSSPFACPVCQPKIAERRAEEIRSAVEQWSAQGGICLFVTLTVPHGIDDVLSPFLVRFQAALKRFRSGRAFAALNSGFGRVGLIRAFEITWGSLNGWHPHTHELWFVRLEDLKSWADEWSRLNGVSFAPNVSIPMRCQYAAKAALFDLWRNACVSKGLPEPSLAHGLDLRVAATQHELKKALADYLVKAGRDLSDDSRPLWGVAEEMVRANSKKGRKARRMTPFDFLRAQFDPEISQADRIRYRELFSECIQSLSALGINSIRWSNGLKARFSVEEKTDETIAEESREEADSLAKLELWQWELLLGSVDHRPTVLILAQTGGASVVFDFINSLSGFDSNVPFNQRE